MRFLLRRALHSLLLLVGASMLSFVLVDAAPGDYFETMRLNVEISPSTITALRRQHALSRSLALRYWRWVQSGFKGEWGFSFAYDSPAGPILASRAKNTLLLTGTATLLAWLIALPLGLWAAARPGSWIDALTSGTVSALLATPELVLALLLLLFAVRTGYFPTGGLTTAAAELPRSADIARHLVLPSLCLMAGLLPMLLSHVRTAVRETLQAPFVSAARAYGIPFRRVLLRHVLPAAANPLISLFGLSLGMLISSSLLIEAIFSWPGLGQLMVEAILQRDFFLVIDASVLAAGFFIAGNLLADLLLYASDPRIRAS
jgi:peptide/nickel transport system permease protein